MSPTTGITVPVITDGMAQVDAALALAAAGFYVFPVDHPELPICAGIGKDHDPATCDQRGKHPCVSFTVAADTNPKMIQMWWAGPPRNVGINCGKSGLVVIDEDQLRELKRYADEHQVSIPPTLVIATAKGHHFYFAAREDLKLGNKEGAFGDYSINIRAGNGYVVGPGSVHQTGVVYRIVVALPPAPLPDWVIDGIQTNPRQDTRDGHRQPTPEEFLFSDQDGYERFELPEVIKDGHRHNTLVRYASSLRAREVPLAEAKILMKAAWQRCEQPPVARYEVTEEEAIAKLEDVYERYTAGRSEGYQRHRNNESNGDSGDQNATPAATDDPLRALTDDANAQRLVDVHGHELRRIADMRRWFVWDGIRWALDHEDRAVRAAARELARRLPKDTKEHRAYKRNSLSATGVSSAVRLAEVDYRVTILAAELDARPELLNTPSGVVDLTTGIIRPHEPGLLLTRVTAHGIDLDAPHPRWHAFLAETFQKGEQPDYELIAFMRRLAGLALLGNVREHILPFLHGTGANGKGVFTLVLQGLLGDADKGGYAASAPDGFLMTGRDGAHPTEIARLRGARLVVCSEQTGGKRFDEVKVKKLTGGDILTGRFMHGDFFDFLPSHLIWVLSNHLPTVKEGGPSFWRRVRRIPFLHVVPDDRKILDLHKRLLSEEGPAILGWVVRGAVEVLANGLNDPESVTRATREYEISEDSLASFVEDECLRGSHHWCKISDFRHRYEKHCEEMGAEPLTAKGLGMRLTSEFAVTSGKHSRFKFRIYSGIALQGEGEQEAGGDR
jgi:putative DNA primase/helicase